MLCGMVCACSWKTGIHMLCRFEVYEHKDLGEGDQLELIIKCREMTSNCRGPTGERAHTGGSENGWTQVIKQNQWWC